MNKIVLSPEEVRQRVINLIFVIRTVINSTGMIVGAITLSLIDVILGGFVLSSFLRNSMDFSLFGISISGAVLGWLLSFVFWYIQLLLWEYILQDSKITKEDAPALTLAVVIALIDTFGDSTSVLIGTKNSFMREYLADMNFFGYSLFNMIVNSLFIATTLVTGLNEYLNRLLVRNANVSFSLPKKKYNSDTRNIPKNFGISNGSPEEMAFLERMKRGVKR